MKIFLIIIFLTIVSKSIFFSFFYLFNNQEKICWCKFIVLFTFATFYIKKGMLNMID